MWKWWICFILFLATVLNYLDRQIMALCATAICADFHLNNEQWGGLLSAFRWTYAFAMLSPVRPPPGGTRLCGICPADHTSLPALRPTQPRQTFERRDPAGRFDRHESHRDGRGQDAHVIDFLQSLPFVDGERIGYQGLSYGGHSAIWSRR